MFINFPSIIKNYSNMVNFKQVIKRTFNLVATHRFNVSVSGMLVISDFVSKPFIKSEAPNSKNLLINLKSPLLYFQCFQGV